MKLHELIRQYRKEQNLTQEQLANYLGVTAPAVNKWENGISYPDITLLPALARVLQTDINTLLSFHEEISGPELDQIILDITGCLKSNGYEAGFAKGESYIKQYPACGQLVLTITQILYGYLGLYGITERGPYKQKIKNWYQLLLTSRSPVVRDAAAGSLSQFYIANEDYEKAQELIDSIPAPGCDKRLMQAQLYLKQKDYTKTYEVYERMLMESAAKTYSLLMSLTEVLCIEENFETADTYASLASQTATLLGLGCFERLIPPVLCAAIKKDVNRTLSAFQVLVDQYDSASSYSESRLYSHLALKDFDAAQQKKLLIQAVTTDHTFDFIRDHKEFQALLKKLS